MGDHEEKAATRSGGQCAYVYIVECSDGTFYTGWTRNIGARLRAHNAGHGARYTRGRRPVHLRYWERQPSRAAAMRREQRIKRFSRARKLALIERCPHERAAPEERR